MDSLLGLKGFIRAQTIRRNNTKHSLGGCPLRCPFVLGVLQHHLAIADDRIQRCTQFMAHIRQKGGFSAICVFSSQFRVVRGLLVSFQIRIRICEFQGARVQSSVKTFSDWRIRSMPDIT